MSLSTRLRNWVPLSWRQELKHWQRQWRDHQGQQDFGDSHSTLRCAQPLRITQPILHSSFYENKLKNIERACVLLSSTSIAPQQTWSFWHRLGRPTRGNGFYPGRNLVNGEMSAQVGGGLCQMSSMLYHLALSSGLHVDERHPHSLDIYDDHQRYTPLGADATVVWGTKDLRFFNPHSFELVFVLRREDACLVGEIHSAQPLPSYALEFKRQAIDEKTNLVEAMVNGVMVASDVYVKKKV
ncbi:VanW family protein [Undibacterium sp. LX40W]|uniref:VanW family protein n=1 Tax=Undibacterium nitidum TaxID=2762298 RepID=A0A923HQ89_9BURK|nr:MULTISPECIES: VanW family protein [Undibacterium]MBC3883182.1 VanW family protein [Undibacterium nitidum]MBC3893464.1 VanW family protein [Undibacterium sp. LX40W]